MRKRIAVFYASVTGSTGEVAQAIGEVLSHDGADVTVLPVGEVDNLDNVDAVVLGSSIRAGKWLPEALNFLKQYRRQLAEVPVAYFTTCLTMVDDTPDNRRTVLTYMEHVRQTAPDIEPVGLGLFAGSLDPTRVLAMSVDGPQGDYRDWNAIREWATAIRSSLQAILLESTVPEVVLRSAILAYTDLSHVDLQRADLTSSDIHEARLSDADLQEASLNWANLSKSDLHGSDLRWANLMGADLHQANLQRADLTYAILNGANLNQAQLQGADLSHADLNWADLRNADLSRANLTGANLGWCKLSGADLTDTNFSQAKYNQATEWPEGFVAAEQGAILVGKDAY